MIKIKQILSRIWGILRDLYGPYRLRMISISGLGILGSLFEGLGISILIPLFVFFIGDTAANQSNIVMRAITDVFTRFDVSFGFKTLLCTALVLFLSKAVVLFVLGYIRAQTIAKYRMSVRSELYRNFLNADFSYLQRQKVGHLDSILMAEVKQSSRFFDNLISFMLNVMSMAGYVGVSFFLSPHITLLVLVAGGGFLLLFRPLMTRIRRYSRELVYSGKEVSHFLAQALFGMKAIKTAGVESAVFDKALALFKTFERLEFRKQITKNFSKLSLEPFSIVFILGVFSVSYLYLEFNITTFIAIVYLIQQVFAQVDKIQSALHMVSETMPSALAVLSAMREAKEESIAPSGTATFSYRTSLEFRRVGFRFKRAEILKDITFSITQGESVGIIGPSGAGKTTLVDMVLRLYRQSTGDILIDGVSISTIALTEWRRNVVYVPQEAFLLNASVAENIRFFDDSITDEDITLALKQAHIYDTVSALPKGVESSVGERGNRLSGGERQRLALARALARKPKILILDEATSALDAYAESTIKDVLKELAGKVTLIIIAHKPSTIEYVDRVVTIKDGVSVEIGTPTELMQKKDSYFRQIYERGSEIILLS